MAGAFVWVLNLFAYAEGQSSTGGGSAHKSTALDGKTQAINHFANQPWGLLLDYQMIR